LSIDFTEDKGTLKTVLDHITNLFKDFKPNTEDHTMPTLEEVTAKNVELASQVKDLAAKFSALEDDSKKEVEKADKEFNEKLTAEKKRADDAEAKIASGTADAKKAEFTAYLDSEIKEGRVLPANKEMYLETMLTLDGQEAMDFTEGDKTKKVTQLELFKKQISAGPAQVSFGEAFKSGTGPKTAGDSLSLKTREIEKANPEMSHSLAFKQAQEENPELTILYSQDK